MQNTNQRHSRMNKTIIIVSVILLILVVGALYHNSSHNKAVKESLSNSQTKTIVKGTPSKPTQHTSVPSSSNSSSTQGSVTNQAGQTTTSTPPSSQWTTSSSGAITLQQPYPNETIQSGVALGGTANSTVSTVDFILTDSAVGQIAQGSLNVVNGKFSGILNFTNHSTKGTLQVYSPNPTNGAEENIINIDVNYN